MGGGGGGGGGGGLDMISIFRGGLLVKDGMGLTVKNFNIMGVPRKIRFLKGVHEKLICLKRKDGGWGLNSLQI